MGINPYRIAPKLVDQGLGAGGNPAGAGGNLEFNDNCPVPKKEQSETSDYDYRFNSQKKKKQSAEQFELDENVEVKKIDIVDRIKENPRLGREAEKIIKDQAAQRDINHLIEQLSLNNKNPGTHNKKVDGLKNVTEARGKNGGRVYFRERHGTIEILGKSNKTNQDKVVAMLQKMGY
jgi:putative component of toxin-antitoxin plasmid stabilization module